MLKLPATYKNIEFLLSEVCSGFMSYGVFISSLSKRDSERLKLYDSILPKIASFLVEALIFLEENVGIEFKENIPFCYNTYSWDKSNRISGYTNALNPKPSQILFSYYLNHRFCLQEGSVFPRAIKSILNFYTINGEEKTIVYSLDGLKFGLFPDQSSVFQSLLYLLWAQSKYGNNLNNSLLGNKSFDWVKDSFNVEDEYLNFKIDPRSSALKIILRYTLKEFDNCLNVKNYDEWLMGQLFIAKLTDVVLSIFRKVEGSIDIRMKVLLSRIEEVRADTGSVESLTIDHPFENNTLLATQILPGIFKARVGNDTWVRKLYSERVIIPLEFKDRLLEPSYGIKSSKQWIGPSEKYISSLLVCYCGIHPSQALIFSNKSQNNEVNSLGTEVQEKISQANRMSGTEKLEFLTNLASEWRYSWAVLWELAICLDEIGDANYAFKIAVKTICMEPTNDLLWSSLSIILKNKGSIEEAKFAKLLSIRLAEMNG